MQVFPFTFTIDAVGNPDSIVLPADFPVGLRHIQLRPPVGHAWTFYGAGATGFDLTTDQSVSLVRSYNQPPFIALETIGRASLDTGTGSGAGLAS